MGEGKGPSLRLHNTHKEQDSNAQTCTQLSLRRQLDWANKIAKCRACITSLLYYPPSSCFSTY